MIGPLPVVSQYSEYTEEPPAPCQTFGRLRYVPFILALALLALIFLRTPPRRHVDTFVNDSGSAMLQEDRTQLSPFGETAHGDIVTRILKAEAPAATVHLIRVDGPDGEIDTRSYHRALLSILLRKMRGQLGQVVINLSLGSNVRDPLEEMLIKALIAEGVTIVAAAGNDGKNVACFPACYNGVIAVAAADGDRLASYSNWGPRVGIAASGAFVDRLEADLPDRYVTETVELSGNWHYRKLCGQSAANARRTIPYEEVAVGPGC
jgi:hypothetical protein